MDGDLFRKVMGLFATGITVITTEVKGETHGMTANAFMAGSLDPPLCVISVGNKTRLHAELLRSGIYGVSFLGQHQSDVSNHFAGRGAIDVVPAFRHLEGVPVLARALAVVAADVIGSAGCGDHTLFIGRITGMDAAPTAPLVYFRSPCASGSVTSSRASRSAVVVRLFDPLENRAAFLGVTAQIDEQRQLVSKRLELRQALLDLIELLPSQPPDVVTGVLRIFAHSQKRADLLQTEIHALSATNEPQP